MDYRRDVCFLQETLQRSNLEKRLKKKKCKIRRNN